MSWMRTARRSQRKSGVTCRDTQKCFFLVPHIQFVVLTMSRIAPLCVLALCLCRCRSSDLVAMHPNWVYTKWDRRVIKDDSYGMPKESYPFLRGDGTGFGSSNSQQILPVGMASADGDSTVTLMEVQRLPLVMLPVPHGIFSAGSSRRNGSSRYGATNPETIRVASYTRNDGVVVPEHIRTSPNSVTEDNFSAAGNINPYSQRRGYR
jgi:hypothetical protein